jgi:hypothetical protein
MEKTEGKDTPKKLTKEALEEIRKCAFPWGYTPAKVRKLHDHITAVEGEVERLWSREERVFAEAVRFANPNIKSEDLTIYGIKIRDVLSMKGRIIGLLEEIARWKRSIDDLVAIVKEKNGEIERLRENSLNRVHNIKMCTSAACPICR